MTAKDDPTSLGNILLDHGAVTEEELMRALRHQSTGIQLGNLLLADDTIDQRDLEVALVQQAEQRGNVPDYAGAAKRLRDDALDKAKSVNRAMELFLAGQEPT